MHRTYVPLLDLLGTAAGAQRRAHGAGRPDEGSMHTDVTSPLDPSPTTIEAAAGRRCVCHALARSFFNLSLTRTRALI
jgi:hypothetical protein